MIKEIESATELQELIKTVTQIEFQKGLQVTLKTPKGNIEIWSDSETGRLYVDLSEGS